jgi:hypothetical protein
MNVEIGTEAPKFLFWEYLFQIFGILSLQCTMYNYCTCPTVQIELTMFIYYTEMLNYFYHIKNYSPILLDKRASLLHRKDQGEKNLGNEELFKGSGHL